MRPQIKRALTLCLLLAVLVSTLVTPVLAESETMKIKYIFWGTTYHNYSFTYDDGTTATARMAGMNIHFLNGQVAYCLEPQKSSTADAIYSSFPNNDQNFWYTKLSAAKREAILLAIAYGAPNQLTSTNAYMNYGYMAATQIVIWEFIMGFRSVDPPYQCTNSSLYSHMSVTSGGHAADQRGMREGYQAISNALAAHGTVPSFSSTDSAGAPSYEMAFDAATGKYTLTLTDKNHVLSQYPFFCNGVTVKRSGDTLTLTASASAIEGKTVQASATGPSPDVSNIVPVIWGTSAVVERSDQILMQSGAPSPLKVYFNLTAAAPSGTAAITKTSDTDDVSGYCFKIYQYGTNKSFYGKSDASGKVYVTDSNYSASGTKNYTFSGLTDGNTVLLEALSQKGDGAVFPDSIRITITNGGTTTYDKTFTGDAITKDANGDARLSGLNLTGLRNGGTMSITIHNKSLSVPLEIVKTSTDGHVEGISFQVDQYVGGRWTKLGTYTTDADGKIHVPGFQIGDRLRVTEDVPTGYTCSGSNPKILTMAAGTNTVEFQNIPVEATLDIVKTSSDGKVAGIAFDIEQKDGSDWTKLGTYTTDKAGKIHVQGLKQGDVIRVTENVPTGYSSDNPTQEIRLGKGTNTLRFVNTPVPCTLEIIKESPDGNVDGIEFKVSRFDEANGWEPYGHYFTENGGKIVLEGLHYADLLEVEELVPEGYVCTSENPQQITIQTGTNTLTFTNDPIAVYFDIIKEATDGQIAGIRFTVEKLEQEAWTEVGQFTTNESGRIRVEGLLVGDRVRITEEVPEGYHCTTDNPQELTVHAGLNRVKFRNAPDTSLEILKTSPDGNVSGIEFKVARWNGRMFYPIVSYFTDESGRISVPNVLYGQTFQIREVLPEGYHCLSENPQEITLEMGTNTVRFENEPDAQLLLVKTSDDGKVEGISFRITDVTSDGKQPVLGTFTTGADGKLSVSGITEGHRYRVEELVPEGYVGTEPVQTFTAVNGINELHFENRVIRGSLRIIKVDADSETPLAGAGFRVLDAEGAVVSEGFTDEAGVLLFENLPYGEYTVTEFQAPEGYLLEDTVFPFSVVTDAEVLELPVENTPNVGSLAVYKINEKHEPLAGVTFLLEYSTDDGASWQPVQPRQDGAPMQAGTCDNPAVVDGLLTSGEDGRVRYTGLAIAAAEGPVLYRLTEIATVNGYNLLAEPAFEGSLPYEGTSDFEITVINTPTYTLPVTGRRGFWGIGIVLAATGAVLGSALMLLRKKPEL